MLIPPRQFLVPPDTKAMKAIENISSGENNKAQDKAQEPKLSFWSQEELEKIALSTTELAAWIEKTKGYILEVFEKQNMTLDKEILWPSEGKKELASTRTQPDILLPIYIYQSVPYIFKHYGSILSAEEKVLLSATLNDNSSYQLYCQTSEKETIYHLKNSLPVIRQKPLPFEVLKNYPQEINAQTGLYLTKGWKKLLENSIYRLSVEEVLQLDPEIFAQQPSLWTVNVEFFKDRRYQEVFTEFRRQAVKEKKTRFDLLRLEEFKHFTFNADNKDLLLELVGNLEKDANDMSYQNLKEIEGAAAIISPLDYILKYRIWDLSALSVKEIKAHKNELQIAFKDLVAASKSPLSSYLNHIVKYDNVNDKDSENSKKAKLKALIDKDFLQELLAIKQDPEQSFVRLASKSRYYEPFFTENLKQKLNKYKNSPLLIDRSDVEQEFENLNVEKENIKSSLEKKEGRQNAYPEHSAEYKKLEKEIAGEKNKALELDALLISFSDLLLGLYTELDFVLSEKRIKRNMLDFFLKDLEKNPTPNKYLLALKSLDETSVEKALSGHIEQLTKSDWASLLELTQREKSYAMSHSGNQEAQKHFRKKLQEKKNLQRNPIFDSMEIDHNILQLTPEQISNFDRTKAQALFDISAANKTPQDFFLKKLYKYIASGQPLSNTVVLSWVSALEEESRRWVDLNMEHQQILHEGSELGAAYQKYKEKKSALLNYINQHRTTIESNPEVYERLLQSRGAIEEYNLSLEVPAVAPLQKIWERTLSDLPTYFFFAQKTVYENRIFIQEEEENEMEEKAKHLLSLSVDQFSSWDKEVLSLYQTYRTTEDSTEKRSALHALGLVLKEHDIAKLEQTQSQSLLASTCPLLDKYQEFFIKEYLKVAKNNIAYDFFNLPYEFLNVKLQEYQSTHGLTENILLIEASYPEYPHGSLYDWVRGLSESEFWTLLDSGAGKELLVSILDNTQTPLGWGKEISEASAQKFIERLFEECVGAAEVWKMLGSHHLEVFKKSVSKYCAHELTTEDEFLYSTQKNKAKFLKTHYSPEEMYGVLLGATEKNKMTGRKFNSFYEYTQEYGTQLSGIDDYLRYKWMDQDDKTQFLELLSMAEKNTARPDIYFWLASPYNFSRVFGQESGKDYRKYANFDLILQELNHLCEVYKKGPANEEEDREKKSAQTKAFEAAQYHLSQTVEPYLAASTNSSLINFLKSSGDYTEGVDILSTALSETQTSQICQQLFSITPGFFNSLSDVGAYEKVEEKLKNDLQAFYPKPLNQVSFIDLANHMLLNPNLDPKYAHRNERMAYIYFESLLDHLVKSTEIKNKSQCLDYLSYTQNLYATLSEHLSGLEIEASIPKAEFVKVFPSIKEATTKIETLKSKYELEETLTIPSISASIAPKKHKI